MRITPKKVRHRLKKALFLSRLDLQRVHQKGPSFVVTGMPRSGTKFLATALSNSSAWRVTHDYYVQYGHRYMRTGDPAYLRFIQRKLQSPYYGDVSGVHRRYLDLLHVERKAVIVRNPLDVFLSQMNMDPRTTRQTIEKLHNGRFLRNINEIDRAAENNRVFMFDRMTTDIQYLLECARYLGVDDIQPDDLSLKKVNTRRKRHTIDNIDKRFIAIIDRELGWFIKKYSL